MTWAVFDGPYSTRAVIHGIQVKHMADVDSLCTVLLKRGGISITRTRWRPLRIQMEILNRNSNCLIPRLLDLYIRISLKILSFLSFCYFLIGNSNLSLKARCCYRRRLFLLSVFGICVPTYVYNLVSFGVYLHSICIYVLSHQHIGHGVLKEKAF